MSEIDELRKALSIVDKRNSELQGALEDCSRIASNILGYNVVADLCSSIEIEFRRICSDDRPDNWDCIRFEDICDMVKRKS